MRRSGFVWNERGTGIVEFVALLPALLFILFGTMEASRLWLTVGVVAEAAREGARAGAVTPLTGTPPTTFSNTAAITRINDVLAAGNLSASGTPTVSCSSPCGTGATITSTVSVAFQTPLPLLVPLFGASFTVQQTAQMRFE